MRFMKTILIVIIVAVLVVAGVSVFSERFANDSPAKKDPVVGVSSSSNYADSLFDASRVHTVDITFDDWDGFYENALDKEYTAVDVVIDGTLLSNVAIKAKGESALKYAYSADSPRLPMRIKFDKYEKEQTYQGLDVLDLNNCAFDSTYMKDYVSYNLMSDFGVAAPLCAYAWIKINGEDVGLYVIVEGNGDSFLSRNYGTDNPGALYKPEGEKKMGGLVGLNGEYDGYPMVDSLLMSDKAARLEYLGDDVSAYEKAIVSTAKTDVDNDDINRLVNAIEVLNSESPAEAVDVDAQLRYLVVDNFVMNDDGYTGSRLHNYLLHEQDGKLSMLPWDYNCAFGTFRDWDAEVAVNAAIDDICLYDSSRPMIDWVYDDDSYIARYHELYQDFLSTSDAARMVEDTQTMIWEYILSDPTKFYTDDECARGIETLRDFCILRRESVAGQLNGSIPSTKAEQESEKGKRVDVGELNQKNMGWLDPKHPREKLVN